VELAKTFQTLENSTVSHVCDPDSNRAEAAKQATGAQYAVADLRRVLDEEYVDAVVIASCDHWHAPINSSQTPTR
jgi:predicted dehydrogenase